MKGNVTDEAGTDIPKAERHGLARQLVDDQSKASADLIVQVESSETAADVQYAAPASNWYRWMYVCPMATWPPSAKQTKTSRRVQSKPLRITGPPRA